MTMRDPIISESVMDSPTHDNLKNVDDGCYNKNIFTSKPFVNSRRALRSGAEKITKTLRNVRNTFGNISQVCVYLTLLIPL